MSFKIECVFLSSKIQILSTNIQIIKHTKNPNFFFNKSKSFYQL